MSWFLDAKNTTDFIIISNYDITTLLAITFAQHFFFKAIYKMSKYCNST